MMTHDHFSPSPRSAGGGIGLHGEFDAIAFERAITDLLTACGLASDEPHTRQTARRVRTLWQQRLLGGYDIDPASVLGEGFADEQRDMVIIRDIAVHGICPHHLLPFHGHAHVAYIPGGRLHGFGRIARLVDALGHRFTYQEWLTHDIADALLTYGQAAGAACVIEAEQLCLLLGEDRRGDERVVTQAFVGCLKQSPQLRSEFLQALGRRTS